MTDPHADRLTRIEETLGFAQHDLDTLSAQVREIFDAVAGLSNRMDTLERRLTDLNDPPEADEEPPGA